MPEIPSLSRDREFFFQQTGEDKPETTKEFLILSFFISKISIFSIKWGVVFFFAGKTRKKKHYQTPFIEMIQK
jgi:hypothetical protein